MIDFCLFCLSLNPDKNKLIRQQKLYGKYYNKKKACFISSVAWLDTIKMDQ